MPLTKSPSVLASVANGMVCDLGLLVGLGSDAIGYDIFEGDIYKAHTSIPTKQKNEQKN